jgi:hypothetical protein
MRQLRKLRNARVIVHAVDQVFDGVLTSATRDTLTLSGVREVSKPTSPVALDGALVIPSASILFVQVL